MDFHNVEVTLCASQMSEQEMDEVITRSTHRDSMGSHSSYSLGKLFKHTFKNGLILNCFLVQDKLTI